MTSWDQTYKVKCFEIQENPLICWAHSSMLLYLSAFLHFIGLYSTGLVLIKWIYWQSLDQILYIEPYLFQSSCKQVQNCHCTSLFENWEKLYFVWTTQVPSASANASTNASLTILARSHNLPSYVGECKTWKFCKHFFKNDYQKSQGLFWREERSTDFVQIDFDLLLLNRNYLQHFMFRPSKRKGNKTLLFNGEGRLFE